MVRDFPCLRNLEAWSIAFRIAVSLFSRLTASVFDLIKTAYMVKNEELLREASEFLCRKKMSGDIDWSEFKQNEPDAFKEVAKMFLEMMDMGKFKIV